MSSKACAIQYIARISFLVSLIAILSLGVFGAHTSTASLEPEWSPAGQNVDYSVTIQNNGPATVHEVRIYKNSQYSNFLCDDKPGWEKLFIGILQACFYVVNDTFPGGPILAGESDIFTFSATTPSESPSNCNLLWKFETRDNVEQFITIFDSTSVDDKSPLITKIVGEPKYNDSQNLFISQQTQISLSAVDQGADEPCTPSGIEYCRYRYRINDESWNQWVNFNQTGTSFNFSEDSKHELVVECVDHAGNSANLTEIDHVESQIPETSLDFIGPYYLNETSKAQWIDGVSQLVLTAVDPLPHPSGIAQTKYRVSLLADTYCDGENLQAEDALNCDDAQGNGNWLDYNGPIGNIPESCHMIEFYSVDNLGQTEQQNRSCFFVDKTPPDVFKKIGVPKIIDESALEQLGNAIASWSNNSNRVTLGAYSALLTIPNNPSKGDFAGVDSFFDIFVELQSIYNLTFDTRTLGGYTEAWHPLVVLGVDADNDGVFEAHPLEWEASLGLGPVNASLLGDDSFIQCEAQIAVTTGWINDLDAYSTFYCYTPNVAGDNYEGVYQPLSYYQANDVGRIQSTDEFAMIKLMLGGNPDTQNNQRAYVDDIRLNGNLIMSDPMIWINSSTIIELDCEDKGPHPSRHELIWFRYRVSEEGTTWSNWLPDNQQSCDLMDGIANGDIFENGWCDFDLKKKIRFPESSLHELQWYCVDAVQKKSDMDIEYFKVDNEPPVIRKNMLGKYYGDCPSGTDLDHGNCYISGEGQSAVNISATEVQSIHSSGNVSCDYSVTWIHEIEQEQVRDIVESGSFTDHQVIVFNEDSIHEVFVRCEDAIGNGVEDIETFLVDLTPPNTLKIYYGPKVECEGDCGGFDVGGHTMPVWITSGTDVLLISEDEKSGVSKTYWRNFLAEGNAPCESSLACSLLPNSEYYSESSVDGIVEIDSTGLTVYETSAHLGSLVETFSPALTGPAGYDTDYYYAVKVMSSLDVPDVHWEIKIISDGGALDPSDVDLAEVAWTDPFTHSVGEETYIFIADGDGIKATGSSGWGIIDGELFENFDKIIFSSLAPAGKYTITRRLINTASNETIGTFIIKVVVGWNEYLGAFTKNQDSCHVIEYYSVDNLGNEENTKRQCVFVDNLAPNTHKTIGLPNTTKNGVTYITTSTPITLDCQDSLPHPVDQVSLHYRQRFATECSGLANAQWGSLINVSSSTTIFNFQQDSCHELEYYCTDKLGNEEQHNFEIDVVDTKAPLISQIVLGPQVGTCPPLDNDDVCIIDGVTKIGVDAVDQSPHPVGDVSCSWWYYVTNENGTFRMPSFGNFSAFPISFQEESEHELHVKCKDGLGNQVEDVKMYIVDKTKPVTTKTYQGPFQEDETGNYHWVTNTTNVTLFSLDPEPHPSGVDKINYRVTLMQVIDEQCVQNCQFEGEGNWNTSIGSSAQFKIEEQSCHLIEYYAVDNVNKTEDIKKQCVFVDTTEPLVLKSVGDPKHLCNSTEGCDYFINQSASITLACADQGPHPVGDVLIKYRYRVAPECNELDGLTENDFTTWEVSELKPTIFQFEQDSCHELQYTCVDALGQSDLIHIEIDAVDTLAPSSDKELDGPVVECNAEWQDIYGPASDGCNYISQNTLINLSCVDQNPHPAGHVNIFYRTYLFYTEEEFPQYTQFNGDKVSFSINEDSEHVLEWYCVDALGNKEETHREIDVVDTKGPTATKLVGLPNVPCNSSEDCHYYVTDETPITITCADQSPHPVGDPLVHWQFTLNNTLYGPFDGEDESEDIFFDEDSRHVLEYWCTDALGNKGQVYTEIDVVETVPPVITKTVLGPSLGVCPPVGPDDECYIDGVTKIHVEANDPQPHPVQRITCDWSYRVLDVLGQDGYPINASYIDIVPPFDIQFPEQSNHELVISCHDGLGNGDNIYDVERFIVDKTKPESFKQYSGPFFDESGYHWINTETEIQLSAEDLDPHPSGVDKIFWRWQLLNVPDEDCTAECDFEGNVSWNSVQDNEAKFSINEQSCHLIEFYSVDKVNKTEDVNRQCVFVDTTAPIPNTGDNKVGEPKTIWDGTGAQFYNLAGKCWNGSENQLECYKVTLATRLNLSCNDPQPHPSNHEKLCFNVELDAQDTTEDYCNMYQEGSPELEAIFNETTGFCCVNQEIEDFRFTEETEHNLKYYCEDAVGNVGPVDDEKFKVEGSSFKIDLFKKWNLISVPFVLLNDSPEFVFKGLPNVDSVWTYDSALGTWKVWTPDNLSNDNLKHIQPGWGYWVLEKADQETLVLGGSLFQQGPILPPAKQLVPGWNLIGYFGTQWQDYPNSDDEAFSCGDSSNDEMIFGSDVYCSLNSLVDTQQGFPRWSSLWGFSNCGDHDTSWAGLNACIDGFNRMYAGRGYWIEIDIPELYAPASTCVWNKLNGCP